MQGSQRLHIIHNGRLVKQAFLSRKWRSYPYFGTLSFNRIDQSRFFTTDIGALSLDDFKIKIKSAAVNILPNKSFPAKGIDSVLYNFYCFGILGSM